MITSKLFNLVPSFTFNFHKSIPCKIIKFSIAIFVFTLLGCASNTALKQKDRFSIQTVNVAEHVELTEHMFYQGPKENILGVTFGVFSLPYVEGSKAKMEDIIKAVLKENNIDVREIARSEFADKLEKTKSFNFSSESYNAEFKLSIPYYGLGQTHGLSEQLKPLIGVRGTLFTTRDDKIVWQKYSSVTNLNSRTPSHTLEEYLKNTKYLEQAFNLAASIAINELIKDIEGK